MKLSAVLILLGSVVTFSANAQKEETLRHVSVSAISGTPAQLEKHIEHLAHEHKASGWKITSMKLSDNSMATAILYK